MGSLFLYKLLGPVVLELLLRLLPTKKKLSLIRVASRVLKHAPVLLDVVADSFDQVVPDNVRKKRK